MIIRIIEFDVERHYIYCPGVFKHFDDNQTCSQHVGRNHPWHEHRGLVLGKQRPNVPSKMKGLVSKRCGGMQRAILAIHRVARDVRSAIGWPLQADRIGGKYWLGLPSWAWIQSFRIPHRPSNSG